MSFKRIVIPMVNVAIFVVAGAILYHFAAKSDSTITSSQAEEANEGVPTAVPVRIAPITRTSLHQELTAYGRVEPAPESAQSPAAQAQITPPVASLVAEVHCKEGDHVEKGQLLLVLDTRWADARIVRAQSFVTASQKFADAVAPLSTSSSWLPPLAAWADSAAQAELVYANTQRQMQNITAPIAGTVTALSIRPGEIARPDVPAIDLVDMDHLVLALDIPGNFAPDVKVDQPASVIPVSKATLFQSGTRPATAPSSNSRIVRIDPTIDPATGMTSADVLLPSHSDFTPGQFFSAKIEIQSHADCLTVPAESIVPDALGRPRIAIVSDDQRQATFRFVQLGIREDDLVELKDEDIQPGQWIVTTGAYSLVNRSGIIVVGH